MERSMGQAEIRRAILDIHPILFPTLTFLVSFPHLTPEDSRYRYRNKNRL
jgi:hypothetical protein